MWGCSLVFLAKHDNGRRQVYTRGVRCMLLQTKLIKGCYMTYVRMCCCSGRFFFSFFFFQKILQYGYLFIVMQRFLVWNFILLFNVT